MVSFHSLGNLSATLTTISSHTGALLSTLLYIAIGVLGIGFLIGFHELGHFLFCKLFNIATPHFSIGFGPTIASKKIGATVFSISAIPLGGYVEIAGAISENEEQTTEATVPADQLFTNKPFYQQLLVGLGGIGFNLLFAYGAFIFINFSGLPDSRLLNPFNSTATIYEFLPYSVGQEQGLMVGDTIIDIDHITIPKHNITELITYLRNNPEKQVVMTIDRAGEQKQVSITIGRHPEQQTIGSLGVVFKRTKVAGLSLKEALYAGITMTNAYITSTITAFKGIISKRKTDSLSGPLMIIHLVGNGATKGFKVFLIFLALISINLAVLNLLPLPIFDGGQIIFYALEALLRFKRHIHIISWIMIAILFVYLSIKDISILSAPIITYVTRFFGVAA